MGFDSEKLRDLESLISDRIYLQIEKWNLYLGDAGLSKSLAIECQAQMIHGAKIAAQKACEEIEVKLGQGKIKLPLSKLIASDQMIELEDILNDLY